MQNYNNIAIDATYTGERIDLVELAKKTLVPVIAYGGGGFEGLVAEFDRVRDLGWETVMLREHDAILTVVNGNRIDMVWAIIC